MLRKRSCCRDDLYSSLQKSYVGDKTKLWLKDNRQNKIKSSPIPEEDTCIRGQRKRARSPETDSKPVVETFIKPSQILQIQKAMSSLDESNTGIDKNVGGSLSTSTNKLYSMWDGVFTWMKSAIDFVGLETAPTASTSCEKKSPLKRRLLEKEEEEDKENSLPPLKKKSNHRLTLGPGVLRQKKEENQHNNSLLSPEGTKICTARSLGAKICTTRSLLASAEKFADSNEGLNGLLATPKLSNHVGRTVKKPLMKKVLIEKNNKEQNYMESIPSPPIPPPPPLPPPSLVPPPPPPPSKGPQVMSTHKTGSHNTLQQMQNRLRTRMMRKTANNSNNDSRDSLTAGTVVNFKTQQWVEIQAHKRKIPAAEFLMLAKKKQSEINVILEQLKDGLPCTFDELKTVVERLQDASLWFAGGYREMKEEVILYRLLEKKIELMNECIQIQEDMKSTTEDLSPIFNRPYNQLNSYLDLLRDEFNHKHKQWGLTLQTNALSWVESGLPINKELLIKARTYLGSIVTKYVGLIVSENEKLNETFYTMKTARVVKLKDKIRDGLNLLITYHNVFTSVIPASCITSCNDSHHCSLSCTFNVLIQAVLAVTTYVDVCIKEYNGHIHSSNRQGVCELFEGILKTNSLLKSLVKQAHLVDQAKSTTGLIDVLPNSDKLAADLYLSCTLLIQHISKQSQSIMSSPANSINSKEVILWMMFGCKYVNQTLEVLGSEQADERGVQNLLDQLQQMETLLPKY